MARIWGWASSETLFLDVAPEIHLAGPAGVDDALIVGRDAFRHASLGRGLGNEGRDLAVFDAADPDALLEAGGLVPFSPD